VTPRQLRKNRRYAILACAAVAALLPGDAVTLLLETIPLYLLYEASILLAALVERSETRRPQASSEQLAGASSQGAGRPEGEPVQYPYESPELTVQEIIDHVDEGLSD
jgi:hypothetical protein